MEQQLQNLTLAYAPKERANKPRKLKNDITREMIDDYEAELNRERTFQPSALIPVLEKPTLDETALDERDEETLTALVQTLVPEFKEKDRELLEILEAREAEVKEFEYAMGQLELEAASFTPSNKNKKLLERADRIARKRRENIRMFNENMDEYKDKMDDVESAKRLIEAQLTDAQQQLAENEDKKRANQGEIQRVNRINQQNLKTVEEDIRILNQGFSINQAPGESEEDYLKRIESMKDTKYSVGTQTDAEVYNFKMLKKKLSAILSMPDHELTKTLKQLRSNLQLYEANKKFPLVKARIEKVLGLKANTDSDTLYGIINEALVGVEKEEEVTEETKTDRDALLRLTGKQLKQLWFETTGTKTPKAKGVVLTRKAQIVDELVKLNARIKLPNKELLAGITERLKTGLTPTEVFVDVEEEPERGRTSERTIAPRAISVPKTPEEKKPRGRPPMSDEQKAQAKAKREASKSAEKRAREAKVGAIPNLRQFEGEGMQKLIGFGAIKISPAQLQLYDVLRVREPSKHSIRGLPDTRVSKDMVYILSKVMKGQSPSATELNALSPKERSMYDAVIFKAKLHTQVPHTADMSIADLKRRLSLLEGEVQAGNNNKDIKKELNSVVRQLIELRAISTQNGRNYLKQF